MALSGSFNTNGYEGRYLTFSWTATQSTANNTSTISWTLKGAGTASSSWYKAGAFKVVIAGETVYSSSTRIELYNGTTVASGTKTIKHTSNGAASFSASAEAGIYTNAVNCKGSGSWTLNTIPRAASITAAPNFNDTANPAITYSNPAGNSVTSLQACIASTDAKTIYVPYRDISKTGTSYTFTLTSAERTTLRKAVTSKDGKLDVRFYVKTNIGDTDYYSSIKKTLSLVDYTPTLSPVIKDVGTATTALTGDENKIIKYYNYISVTTGATARKEATIKSQKVTCGNKSITTATGALQNVESGTFTITATDSRGTTVTQTVTKTLVNYVKLTCALDASILLDSETTSKISFTVSGKYFNDTFGAVANTLTVQYRYKTNNGSYSSWTNLTATKSGNSYTATGSISGLAYENTYTLQARAIDKINTGGVNSSAKTLNTKPLFDWSKDDFNFNVPVKLNKSVMPNGAYNYGTTTSGTEIMAICPCNHNNNLVMGYGGYIEGLGNTHLYGNHIRLYTNDNVNIVKDNTTYKLIDTVVNANKLVNVVTNEYSLTTKVAKGSSYAAASATATLVGNNLRIYYSVTRTTPFNDYSADNTDISNEVMATLTITHGGKIKTAYNTSFINGNVGNTASFQTEVTDNGTTSITVDLKLCAITSRAGTIFSGFFSMPVILNLDAY